MEKAKKKTDWIRKHPMISIILFIILMGLVLGKYSDKPLTSNSPSIESGEEFSDSFEELAKEHFSQVEQDFNEFTPGALSNIECLDNCSSVVYFNFNTRPTDLEMVISLNAVAFSNLKQKSTEVSHVSIIAELNGEVIYQCDASYGEIDECK